MIGHESGGNGRRGKKMLPYPNSKTHREEKKGGERMRECFGSRKERQTKKDRKGKKKKKLHP